MHRQGLLRWSKAWLLGDIPIVKHVMDTLLVFPAELGTDQELGPARIRAGKFGESRWVEVRRLKGRRKLAEVHYNHRGEPTVIVWPSLFAMFD